MNILKSVIRTFFIEQAINALVDKIRWNLKTFSRSMKYPRSRYGVLDAARDGMFPRLDGGAFSEEMVERHIDDHGLEATIDTLSHFCLMSGTSISDFIMER